MQDGPASNEAWVSALDWPEGAQFARAERRVVRARDVEEQGGAAAGEAGQGSGQGSSARRRLQAGGTPLQPGLRPERREGEAEAPAGHGPHAAAGSRVVGYWKRGGGLTHVVLTDAGHMAPRDAPRATQWMLETWLGLEVRRDAAALAAAVAVAAAA